MPRPTLTRRATPVAGRTLPDHRRLGFGLRREGGGDIQEPSPVAVVSVTAPSTTIESGQTLQLAATARNASGTVIEGRTFEWTTADAAVASVSPAGLVTGLNAGQVEIRATTEGVTGSETLAVRPLHPAVRLPWDFSRSPLGSTSRST